MEDLEDVWSLVERERDRLGVWMPWVELTRTIEDERRFLEAVVSDPRNLDGLGLFVEGRFAGGVGMRPDQFGIVADIGYWIGSPWEGRGFVTRAVRALLEIAFEELGLHRVTIRAGVENLRSRAIAERLGFTLEGTLRGEGRGVGGFYDLALYGLLEDEWRAGRPSLP
jgi:ribosomal-protein-serine acetyltransferase